MGRGPGGEEEEEEGRIMRGFVEGALADAAKGKGLLPPEVWWWRVLREGAGGFVAPLSDVEEAAPSGDAGGSASGRDRGRRRLLDTYGESLIHVNRLYHQVCVCVCVCVRVCVCLLMCM
jgi:hypothetical protein